MVDAGDTTTELLFRERLHYLALEAVEPARHRAAHCRRPAERRLDPADLHRRIDAAARVGCVRRVDAAIRDRLRGKLRQAGAPAERGWGRRAAAAGQRQERPPETG